MIQIDHASKSVTFNYKSIMPVDAIAFTKMSSLPFVLEVWKKNKSSANPVSNNVVSSTAEEFLGMIRVNLKTIPELLANPYAFASNLYPTMLVEGEIPVWDPSTNRNVAIANITFAFGTVQQVHLYQRKLAAPL